MSAAVARSWASAASKEQRSQKGGGAGGGKDAPPARAGYKLVASVGHNMSNLGGCEGGGGVCACGVVCVCGGGGGQGCAPGTCWSHRWATTCPAWVGARAGAVCVCACVCGGGARMCTRNVLVTSVGHNLSSQPGGCGEG